jgi:hypothetical protein
MTNREPSCMWRKPQFLSKITNRPRQWLQQLRCAVASNELKGAQEVRQRTADYPVVVSGIAPTKHHTDWDARLQPT